MICVYTMYAASLASSFCTNVCTSTFLVIMCMLFFSFSIILFASWIVLIGTSLIIRYKRTLVFSISQGICVHLKNLFIGGINFNFV